MARYIILRVESNDTADTLIERFEAVPAIQLIGLYASATKFCPGKQVCGEARRYRRSKRYGTTHCSICKLPVSSTAQNPRNLLNDPDLHPRFSDVHLSVWEPYLDPVAKYGKESIERKGQQVKAGYDRIKRWKQRNGMI